MNRWLWKLALPAALAVVLLSFGSFAQAATEKGDRELSLNADLGSQKVSFPGGTQTTSTTNIIASFGYFLDKVQQVGGSVDYSLEKPDTGSTIQFVYYEGFYKYHFILKDNPVLVPFVGGYLGQLQFQGGGQSGSGFSYAVSGGVKYFVSENTSANAEYIMRRSSISLAGTTVDIEDNRLFLGLSIYFGKK